MDSIRKKKRQNLVVIDTNVFVVEQTKKRERERRIGCHL
jgi:hypothetical protein